MTLWEDDLKHNQEKVKSLLSSKLDLSNKILKSHYFKTIDYPEDFIKENSLRTFNKSDIYIGLFSNDTLYSIIGLSKDLEDLFIDTYVDVLWFNSKDYLKDFIKFINDNFQFKDLFFKCFKETDDYRNFLDLGFQIIEEIDSDFSIYNYKLSKFRNKENPIDDKNSYVCYDAGFYLLKQF